MWMLTYRVQDGWASDKGSGSDFITLKNKPSFVRFNAKAVTCPLGYVFLTCNDGAVGITV